MEDTKKELSPEFKKFYSSFFREMWMKMSNESIKGLLAVLVKTHIENGKEGFEKEIAVKTLNELMPLVSLFGAIRNCGRPKSLVFISEAGQAIDLLDVKELDENAVFNQVLDNMAEPFKSKTNVN